MVCIYCGNKTQVTNSRSQKKLNQTWRRRECLACRAIFTTLEACDYSASIVVGDDTGSATPFMRDKLYLSIHATLGHRPNAAADASVLTSTIIGRLLGNPVGGCITPSFIAVTALETLQAFDLAAGVQYAAYHPRSLTL